MAKGRQGGWNRRDFIGATALLALAIGVPVAAVRLTHLDAEDAPSDRQRMVMKDVSQLVIPRTGTPGAGETGAGDFAILALAHGLDGTRKPMASGATPAFGPSVERFLRNDGSLRHVAWLERILDDRAGGDFLGRPFAERGRLLAALDAEAFAEGAGEHPWKAIKGLILTGYYTGEVGGSQELQYVHVPGRFDPDLPLTPGFRAISSDWTAVDFG